MIDPSIPLQANAGPAPLNPVQTLAGIGQIRQQQQQAALGQQQLESNTMTMDAQKRALVEDQRLRELFAKGVPSAGDLYSTVGPVRGNEILKGLAAMRTDALKTSKEIRDTVGSMAGGILALPAPMQEDAYKMARQSLLTRGVNPEDVPEQFPGPEGLRQIQTWAMSSKEQVDAAKPPALTQHDPEKDLTNPTTGAVVVPGVPAVKKHAVTVPGPQGQPIQKLVTEDELAKGIPAYVAPKATDGAKFWVIRNGSPVRITEAEYRQGDLPSNTREQGRPVTSGDAGKVAEFDTSLDDVAVLEGVVTGNKATGAAAKIGAMLPNAVTEFTGWGADAKSKQAVIDRVKQVIGKALEGGVLRKEDEAKYEKILPTIGDPAEVVKTKLAGLTSAIKQRRSRFLEALKDADYDTGNFPSEYKPKGAKIRARDAQGTLHEAAPGTALPAGWKLEP